MNIRNGWRGAMRRALEASNIVVGAEKQIPRGPGSAGDDKSEEPSTAKEQQFLRPGRGLANASSLEISAAGSDARSAPRAAAGSETARRTVPLPSILTSGAPTLVRAGVMPKPTPANLRRFAELPIARKAINSIKDRVAGMQWRIEPRRGRSYWSDGSQVSAQKKGANLGHTADPAEGRRSGSPEQPSSHISHTKGYVGHPSDIEERIAILTENFEGPNPEDSFRSMIEQVLEDVLVGGFGAIEIDLDRRCAAAAGVVAGGWREHSHQK